MRTALPFAALLALLPVAGLDATPHRQVASMVTGLPWYTDVDAATSAAKAEGKPILHLRMLGRLDETLSCANSRLFRATLYANREVSAFLRENFILVWTSERPVPRVTIDFGDGRKLERTTTGNSAHYVLHEDGVTVLDVLPGVYAPAAFVRELTDSLELAKRVRGKTAAERAKAVVAYHEAEAKSAANAWAKTNGKRFVAGATQLMTDSAIAMAQQATFAKAAMEVPDLRTIMTNVPASAYAADDVPLWATAGQAMYGIEHAHVLDDSSIAHVMKLHDAVPDSLKSTPGARTAMLRRLEQHIVADSALNQLRLRPQISREIIRRSGHVEFETFNNWIYANVFHTPASDPWLGLVPRTDFTGLPGDGVVMP